MGQIEERLKELGTRLPEPPKPVAKYVPLVVSRGMAYVSGQGPIVDGQPAFTGRVPDQVTPADAQVAARLAGLNALAILQRELGTLDRVARVVKLLGWVASAPGFGGQPDVMNGASELMHQVFGERGRHARTAVGTNQLPNGIPVEVEMIVELRD